MNTTSAVSVAFDPLLPWPVLIALGAVGLVLVLLGLRARARGTLWRWLAVIVVLAALANPSLIEEQRKPIADVALVVTDDSDSMAIGDRRTQVQAAREALKRSSASRKASKSARSRPAGRLEVREASCRPRTSSSAASGPAARG